MRIRIVEAAGKSHHRGINKLIVLCSGIVHLLALGRERLRVGVLYT
jgi:hypothetical protein